VETNHFAHAGSPADQARAAEYEAGPYAGFAKDNSATSSAFICPLRVKTVNPCRTDRSILKVIVMLFGPVSRGFAALLPSPRSGG